MNTFCYWIETHFLGVWEKRKRFFFSPLFCLLVFTRSLWVCVTVKEVQQVGRYDVPAQWLLVRPDFFTLLPALRPAFSAPTGLI